MKILRFAVGPRAAKHFLQTRTPSVYGSKLEDPHFCGSCVWSLLVLSLGIFDIAALKPNWTELSWWRENDGEINWTGFKWRLFILIIPFVWILEILISLHCLDSLRSKMTLTADLALRAPSTFWLYHKYGMFHAAGSNWTFFSLSQVIWTQKIWTDWFSLKLQFHHKLLNWTPFSGRMNM